MYFYEQGMPAENGWAGQLQNRPSAPEGELAWKPKSNLFTSPQGGREHSPFLAGRLKRRAPRQYHFTYRGG